MTRDEAEKIAGQGMYPGTSPLTFNVRGFVSLLDALGVLKLDKPQTARDKFKEALRGQWNDADAVYAALDAAGLKVIEK